MGYSPGLGFKDEFRGQLHVEAGDQAVSIWNAGESEQVLRLQPDEARKLVDQLKIALCAVYGDEWDDL